MALSAQTFFRLIGAVCLAPFVVTLAAMADELQPHFQPDQDPKPAEQKWVPVENMSDEFDGDTLDRSKWQDEPLGNGWRWYGRAPGLFRAENVKLQDGRMCVTVGKLDEPVVRGGKTFTHQGAIVRSIHPGQPGMYFECRMKANATIMSSTFWLMTRDGAAKRLELDIQECIGRVTDRTASWAKKWDRIFHSNMIQHADKATPEKVQLQNSIPLETRNSEQFHVYGGWWKSPDEAQFFLDGKYIYSIKPKTAWDIPAYIQMAVEIYDWNPIPEDGGLVESGTWDQRTTQYDWVRVWKLGDAGTPQPAKEPDASPAQASAKPPTQPSILFIFADDQRSDTIAALGNPIIKTPNLDRLVHNGLSFTRAYMQGGFNGATCVPSRAMLLSGRSLFHADEKLMDGVTWPEAFGRAGYTTFMSGKWHNGAPSLPKAFQTARGVFAGGMTDPMHARLSNLENGKLTAPKASPKHTCQVFAEETVRFIKEHKDGPFLAYMPFDGPHDPHIVPDDFPVHYDAAKIPLPPNYLPLHPFDNGEMVIRDEKLLPWPRTPESVRAQLADYYRYISFLDSLIGQVLDALAASPFAKNTIVVFTSDSGVARGSHGLNGKQNLYEHSVGVPLIISGPGIPADKKTDAMCYLFDVLPTLGSVCGVPAPKGSDGIDLSAVLRDQNHPGRADLVFAYKDVQRAIRDARWKLIRYPQVNVTQLFDLATDPLETHDLAADSIQAERVHAMTAKLGDELKRADDKAELVIPNSKPAAITADQLNQKAAAPATDKNPKH